MCGIAGGYWPVGQDQGVDIRLRSAVSLLRHRGPDDSGILQCDIGPNGPGRCLLGHTRLSILDLSDAGHQPMTSVDGRYSLVYNGEVYNYLELRRELTCLGYRFVSNTDTEVVLAAWAQWGDAAITRFLGMFAFVVLDRLNQTLTCVRDPFGIKPFLYTYDSNSGSFQFASELTPLLVLSGRIPHLNWQSAYDYLVHGVYDHGKETFVSGICHLLPSHLMVFDLKSETLVAPRRYWIPQIGQTCPLSFNDAAEQLRELFLESVRLHLRSDVRLGVALSGGIDSSAVTCAIQHLEPSLPLDTFSYVAEDSPLSEERWVDRINRQTGATSHKVVLGAHDLVRDLDELILAQGEPFGGTSIYAQYRVFKLARDSGVAVTLEGQGGDELLAGYNGYLQERLASLVEMGRPIDAIRLIAKWSSSPGRTLRSGLMSMVRVCLPVPLKTATARVLGRNRLSNWLNGDILREQGVVTSFKRQSSPARGRRLVEALAHALTQRGLVSLLRHADRNSMRFSIESRVPFLSTKLADFVLALPEQYLLSAEGTTKNLFRAAMHGIVCDEVLRRKDKIAFATPEKDWFTELKPVLNEWLEPARSVPFLRHDVLIRETVGTSKPSPRLWHCVNLIRWLTLLQVRV